MSKVINVALEKSLHGRIMRYTKKSETMSQGIERAFMENDHIDTLKKIVEKTVEAIEEGKKKGFVNPSAADELVRAVHDFITDVEQR